MRRLRVLALAQLVNGAHANVRTGVLQREGQLVQAAAGYVSRFSSSSSCARNSSGIRSPNRA
jgi:hypothetical protein